MAMKIMKLVLGILAIPVMFGVTYAFYNNITTVSQFSGILNYFIWGIVSYVFLHLLFYKPMVVYVLGHEAVHAVFAWVMGGKISSFNVSKDGGSVTTDKSNVLIELSPYFVPIYAIIIMAVYFIISYSYKVNHAAFAYIIGFALAFHVVMTIEAIKVRQPDILESGYLFSIVFIYVLNIVVISLLFSLMFRSFSAKHFFVDTLIATKGVYIAVLKQLFS